MKKRLKLVLIAVLLLIGIIILDTFQALIFNNNPVIGMQTWCKSKNGLFVTTYHCNNGNNVTKFRKSKECNYDSVCKEKKSIDYLAAPNDLNNLIIQYFTKKGADLDNFAYNYVDEENNKVTVGLLDIDIIKQDEFITKVFTECCGSDYVRFIKEHKLISFVESKDIIEARIIEIKENAIVVEVLKESKSFKKNDKVIVKKIKTDIYTIGDKVRITFNGMVETSNPAQIGANKIEVID